MDDLLVCSVLINLCNQPSVHRLHKVPATPLRPAFENWVAMTNVYQNLDDKGSGEGCEGKVILLS